MYKREVALHEETYGNLEKARETAKTFQNIVTKSQQEGLAQLRQHQKQTEQQFQQKEQQLAAERESLRQQMQLMLAAKDEAIAELKRETNEIREGMKKQFELVSTELASATESINSKQTEIEKVRAEMEKLETDLAICLTQVQYTIIIQ